MGAAGRNDSTLYLTISERYLVALQNDVRASATGRRSAGEEKGIVDHQEQIVLAISRQHSNVTYLERVRERFDIDGTRLEKWLPGQHRHQERSTKLAEPPIAGRSSRMKSLVRS